MTDVHVPFEGKAKERATLLLAAAVEAGEPASVVRTADGGGFYAPEEIVKAAGLADEPDSAPEEKSDEAPKRPAKKAAAKKSTRSKSKE